MPELIAANWGGGRKTVTPLFLFGSERMPTATRARRTTHQKPIAAYRLTTGSWGVAASTPPDFGPIREGEQVRVVKDVLKVGKWKTGFDASGQPVFWDVTPQTLSQLVNDFNAQKAAGNSPNLGKTHGDDNLLIHPDDLIAPIDALKIAGDTLYMSAYVSPEQHEYLSNEARKVSVGVVPDYTDGAGKTYKLALVHVAVTDRPVMVGQAPFLSMADGLSGGSAMDFAALLASINSLLEALGMSALPDDTAEENIVERLIGVSVAMGTAPEAKPEETPAPEMEDAPMDELAAATSGMPRPMADKLSPLLKKQQDQIKTLSDQLSARDAADAAKAKAAFDAKIAELGKAGVTKAVLDSKIALAVKLKTHDLALLDGLAPTLNTGGSAAKRMASSLPASSAKGEDDERQDIAKDIAKRRGITLENALKLVP